MGGGSTPSQAFVVERHAQTLLKAETGDRAPAGREKALAQSLSNSVLLRETCRKSQSSLVAPVIPVWL